jgi:choice-of-anchor B domain-containing protein
VDISDPVNPVYLGRLNSHTGFSSTWRDVKVYQNHAYIVSDSNSGHGMQVFDLTELRNVVNPPVVFSNTAHYNQVSSAHNVAINEDTGYAYIVGASSCSGGLHMVDISTPTSPTFAGCFSADGYTHDVQCAIYNGPDTNYQGSEICFAANEDTLTIVDVTNKNSPVQLSRNPYAGAAYSHQGWLTEDHAYFLLSDELDELSSGNNTTTYLWDLSDLTAPVNFANYVSSLPTIDHNVYTHNGYAFESNYTSGLRIINLDDIANGNLVEEAYFDTYPGSDSVSFSGQWSNYPYFASGVVIANDRNNGLFVLQPTMSALDYDATLGDSAEADKPGTTVTHSLTISNTGTQNDSYNLSLMAGSWSTTLQTATPISVNAGAAAAIEVTVDIPAGATLGETYVFTVTATSVNDPGLTVTGNGTTTVVGTAGIITSGDTAGSGAMGSTVEYTLVFTNSGDINDTFTLSLSGNAWDTQLSSTNVGPLAPGESGQVTLSVEVGSGTSDVVSVQAVSAFDGTETATITVTTNQYLNYLPVMLSQP